jgi:hypothetical protein
MTKHIGSLLAVAFAFGAIGAGTAHAEKQAPLSGLALQQIQSRDFEAPKSITFPATISILQDGGYRIGDADIVTGIITATASTKTKTTWLPFVGFGTSKKTPVVSVFVEDMGPNLSRVRLNFVMGKLKNGLIADETPIYDAATYKDAFERIGQAVFIRQAMTSKPTPTPSVATPSATGSEAPVAPPPQ